MPVKSQGKKPAQKKSSSKKLSLSRLAMIVFAIILALAFILFSVYSPKSKRTATDRPVNSTNKGVEFRKDGTLRIITSGSEIKLDIEVADEEEEHHAGADVPLFHGGKPGHAVHLPQRGTPVILDEKYVYTAGYHLLK